MTLYGRIPLAARRLTTEFGTISQVFEAVPGDLDGLNVYRTVRYILDDAVPNGLAECIEADRRILRASQPQPNVVEVTFVNTFLADSAQQPFGLALAATMLTNGPLDDEPTKVLQEMTVKALKNAHPEFAGFVGKKADLIEKIEESLRDSGE